MLLLPNGCRCSDISVHPKEWKKQTKISCTWYIHYRFYAADFPKPRQVVVKGMNHLSNIQDRKAATKALIENEMDMLINRGYNPFLKRFINEELYSTEINPETPLIKALKYALDKSVCNHCTKLDITSVLKYFTRSANQLNYANIPVGSARRKHIRLILDNIGNLKPNWTDNNFNHYRKYLSKLFSELIELEAVEFNPIRDIAKRKTIKRLKETISPATRSMIDQHLRIKKQYRFRLYMRIFFHSGCRSTELLTIKAKDVHLDENYFICTIQKGTQVREVKKTIKDISVRYWRLALKGAEPNDFIFSKGLKPGSDKITSAQITRRWETHVKIPLKLNAGFYSLKHSHTTEAVDLSDVQTAASINGHISTAMVISIYDVKNNQRNHNNIRNLKNYF